MVKYCYIISLFLLPLSALWGQHNSDTLQLEEASVTADRLDNFTAGSEIVTVDSATRARYRSATLSQLLSFESPVYIRNYGPGSLTTTSLRGGNASHTAVTWNGFVINSPLTGQLDFSLVPVSLSEDIQLQYGASTALWGSGAVGGAIHLNSKPNFNRGLFYGGAIEARRFEASFVNFEAGFSSKRYTGRFNVINSGSPNRYFYKNPYTGEREFQKNARYKTESYVFENFFRLSNNEVLSLHGWYQTAKRQIPPTLLQDTSKSSQRDQNLRITSEWRKLKNNLSYALRAGFFEDRLTYFDSISEIYDTNNSLNLIGEAELTYFIEKGHKVMAGINYTRSTAEVDNFNPNPLQQRFALFSAYQARFDENFMASFSLRQELLDGDLQPLTYTLGATLQLLDNLTVNGQFSKVYRLPTLNDRYWNPGGNPDLLAESGLAQEVGFYYLPINKKNLSLSFKPTFFNRRVNNQIIWLPEGGIWTPQNLLEVWSRGLETQTTLKFKTNKLTWQIGIATSYVLATNEKSTSGNDASQGLQLIYTPIYSGNASLSLRYKRFDFYYVHQYNGYTYTAADHSEYLEPYQLGTARISYRPEFFGADVNVYLQADNIWNQSYQVVQNRPMPLQVFAFGASFNFSFKQ